MNPSILLRAEGLAAFLAGTVAFFRLGGPRWLYLVLAAAVWTAHIGADRLVGYGLKYPTGFGDTHLSGRSAAENGDLGVLIADASGVRQVISC